MYNLHHIARSMLHQIEEEHRIAGYDQEALFHMGHHLDLQYHPLQFVCNPFKVEVEGELTSEAIVEMVGKVMVKMMRDVVVHLSQHCLLPYPPYLPITRYFHTSPYLPITRYFYTPINAHITFHTPKHLHIFTTSGVAKVNLHSSRYHLIIPPFIIPYIACHR